MYKRLIKFLITEFIHLPSNKQNDRHWGSRVVMDKSTNALVKALKYQDFSTMEISGSKWKDFGFQKYISVDFPDFDICSPSGSHGKKFDMIIAEQVFEHLSWPYQAVKNVYDMLNPNGHFLITTPFLIRIHLAPTDSSRWTETGLKHLLADGGFDMDHISTGSWGNIECITNNFNKRRSYRSNRLENQLEFPMVINWALAKRLV